MRSLRLLTGNGRFLQEGMPFGVQPFLERNRQLLFRVAPRTILRLYFLKKWAQLEYIPGAELVDYCNIATVLLKIDLAHSLSDLCFKLV